MWIYVIGMHTPRARRLRLVTAPDQSINQEKGVNVLRSTFKAIVNQGIRTPHPKSVKIVINLLHDFCLARMTWRRDNLLLGVRNSVWFIRNQQQMNPIQHFKQVILSLAHSVRFISDKTYRASNDHPARHSFSSSL
jgi:hypothetical protein